MIKPCGDKFCVYDSTGKKLLGEHPTEAEAQQQLAAIESNKSHSINDVEIFATGKHNGDTYTDADLENMVSAFNELDFAPAVKIGHTKETGGLAYGYLSNLRKIGGKLITDITDMPRSVYESVKGKQLGRVSAEVYWNMERGGKKYPRVLGALALLGQEIPGVAGLKPLHKMFSDGNGEMKIVEYEKEPPMAEDLKTYAAQVAALEAQVKEMKAVAATQAADYEAKLQSSNATIAKLIADGEEKKAKEFADSIKIPALRPLLKAVFSAVQGKAETIKIYSADGKTSEDKTLETVIADIAKFVNEKADVLFSTQTSHKESSSDYSNAGAEVDRLAKAAMSEKKLDYGAAVAYILSTNKDLAVAYNAQAAQ